MSKGISITYRNVAPEAKENFNIEVSEKKFDTIGNLQQYNMQTYNYANPCELYQTVLDGTATALPSDPSSANIGLWSEQLSNDDGTFAEPIIVTLESEGQYSSPGFTFTFDKFNGIFPTRLTIQWFRVTDEGVEALTEETEFAPSSSFYFCEKKIENFNKVIIKFYALNMPNNRLKVEVIDYGYGTIFYGDSLRNVHISQKIDPISSELPINTSDFTLDSHTNIEYSFQAKQPLSISFNDQLRSTAFIKSSKRSALFLWDVSGEDYVSMLDGATFIGDIYENISAATLLKSIFGAANVPFEIPSEAETILLSGHIGITTCREALLQVCVACQFVVDTSDSSVVKVKVLSDDVKQTIPLSRIKQGQSIEDSDTVTAVEVVAHQYVKTDELEELYKAEDSGSGENIYVSFSEPHAELVISNGTITESNANYAIINAESRCVLRGYKYNHVQTTKKKSNAKVLASELQNVVKIESATLVSSSNVDMVLEKCYNELTKTRKVNMSVIERKQVEYGKPIKYGQANYGTFNYRQSFKDTVTYDEPIHLGDVITCQTSYLGDITGRVISQSYNLNGNIIVKEVVIQ